MWRHLANDLEKPFYEILYNGQFFLHLSFPPHSMGIRTHLTQYASDLKKSPKQDLDPLSIIKCI